MTAAKPQPRNTVPPGYKQTEVGVIPEDWEVRRFSDHFDIYAGGDVPKKSLSKTRSAEHPYPVFANATKGKGLYGFTGHRRASPNSVTITARGYLGHAEYREEPFFPIVRLLVLEPTGLLDAKYTTYAINDRVTFSIESTGVPQLTAPQVGKYAVAAPPTRAEQEAIAGALSDADAWIESLEKLIAKKRAIKQGAMQSLLTPPGQPGHRRLPGFEGEWEVKRLGEMGTFLKGAGVRKNEAISGALPCVRYGEIYTHHHDYIRQFFSWISRDVALTSVRLRRGDILFAGSGETREEIGKCVAFVRNEDAYAGGDIVILRPEADIADSLFLGYYLNAHHINLQKSSRGQGDAVVHIGAKALGAIEATMPSVDEQTAIAAVLSDMDAETETLETKLAKARQVKQGMVQELLTGRVRLV